MTDSATDKDQTAAPLSLKVLAEQLRIIIVQTPKSAGASAAMAIICALAFWNQVAHQPILVVMCMIFAVDLWWLAQYWRYKRSSSSAADAPTWATRTVLRASAHGSCWGAYSLAIFVPDSIAFQGFDVAFIYGLTSASVVATAPHFRTFIAFCIPALVPVIVRCFFEGTLSGLGVGLAGLVGLIFNLSAGFQSYRTTAAAIRIRLENMDLVRALEQQKAAAESARTQAEAASQSKSRFLAAASHDLRQPVHALSLFVSAAKQAGTEPQRKRIIEHIEKAVGSLAILFDSLLDISRLDAGILQAQLKTVALAPILRKIAAEHVPLASEKRLEFRVRCPDFIVHTDPVLFEGIVRNLLTNAMRYTQKGGILLSARKRGACARVEVWDTGIGIPPDKRSQVFEEFYQIDNPERDRGKGVGLGLAIVKRTAELLQHPLSLASRPGSGSRFGIDLPISALAQDPSTRSAAFAVDDEVLLFGMSVVVIDDEADIRAALELLLKQWGCQVIVADCCTQAHSQLQAREKTPDLILSDYRLRGAETGIDAIHTLRLTYGDEIPALLVTGDTAADRLRDVAASGLVVLHKPLNADQLKQALLKIAALR
jgi:two-component system, sensor histidine kinase